MSIKRIFLDLDGVCNRLIMHALEVNDCNVSRYHDELWPTPGSYDIIAAANKLLGKRSQATHESFWGTVTDEEVWQKTPVSGEFHYLLRASVDAVGKENVCILTSPVDLPGCSAGKHEWFRRHMPSNMKRQFAICQYKKIFATPDALLIDDSDAEVDAWRARGGQALLVPRPWNSRHAEDTERVLLDYFGKMPTQSIWFQSIGLIPKQPA